MYLREDFHRTNFAHSLESESSHRLLEVVIGVIKEADHYGGIQGDAQSGALQGCEGVMVRMGGCEGMRV